MFREHAAYHSLILLRGERTGRVDEHSSFFQERETCFEETCLDCYLLLNVLQRPESVGPLIRELDPTLSAARGIEQYRIEEITIASSPHPFSF